MYRVRLSDADLRRLRAFNAVVEYGGLSAAATEVGIGLASLSRSLSALEERFGVKLCSRGRGGFRLTEQGREVYAAAQALISNVSEFEHSIFNVARAVRGKIRLGIIDNTLSNPASAIHTAIGIFTRRYPDIYLELTILPKPRIESSVREASIDVGITGDPVFFKSLSYKKFSEEHHYLYAAAGSMPALLVKEGARLADVPYVKRRYRTGVFEDLEKRYELRAIATAGSLEAVAILVAAGVGIGILPAHYVNTLPHAIFEIVPTSVMPITTSFYVLHRADAGEAPIVAEFVRILADFGSAPRGESTDPSAAPALYGSG
jgi:DNA-binding transcriptional LysR family regulator